MAIPAEIEAFLQDFKYKLGFWGLLFHDRLSPKNFKTMTELELRIDEVKAILRDLELENYCEGPLQDRCIKSLICGCLENM
jgi:hypothetical protein